MKSNVKEKRKPKQKRGIETKQRILEAGFNLFSQKGLHGTNSREIATASGVASGTFYSYYKDKRELFIEILKMHKISAANILNEFSTQNSTNRNEFKDFRDLISQLWFAHNLSYEFDQKAAVLRKVDV